MSVQDDKEAGRARDQQDADKADKDEERPLTEKPEPDEDDKAKAAEMMTAYEDRPTLVLPGSGGMVSGTAVNDWLDDEGNPKQEAPDEGRSGEQAKDEDGGDQQSRNEQIEKDKALNEELRQAAAEENKGEKRKSER